MPFPSDLEAAGQRASTRPVADAPSIATVERRAHKHRTKRQMVTGGLVAVVLAAVSVPIVLRAPVSTEVQNVAVAGATQVGESAATQPPAVPPAAQPPVAAATQDDAADESGDVNIELRYGSDFALAIRVIEGDRAQSAADSAETAADDVRDIDGVTAWIERHGDTVTVSALVEPDKFLEVKGPASELDRVLEVLESGDFELPELGALSDIEGFFGAEGEFPDLHELFGADGEMPGFEQFFDENGQPDFEGFFGADGEFPDLEELFGADGEMPGFEQFFDENGQPNFEELFGADGEFPDLEELFGADGEMPGFEEFFADNGQPDFEQFFDPDGLGAIFGTDGCIVVEVDGAEGFRFEYPQGCSAAN